MLLDWLGWRGAALSRCIEPTFFFFDSWNRKGVGSKPAPEPTPIYSPHQCHFLCANQHLFALHISATFQLSADLRNLAFLCGSQSAPMKVSTVARLYHSLPSIWMICLKGECISFTSWTVDSYGAHQLNLYTRKYIEMLSYSNKLLRGPCSTTISILINDSLISRFLTCL